MSAYTHSGHVYFVVVGDYVKIGYSSRPVGQRALRLRTNGRIICPDDIDWSQPIQLLHHIPGCVMRDERRLHGLFAAHHVVGEWFRCDRAFLEHLAQLDYTTYKQGLSHLRRARREMRTAA